MAKNVLFVLSAIAAADTSTHAVDTFDFKASRIGFGFFSIKIALVNLLLLALIILMNSGSHHIIKKQNKNKTKSLYGMMMMVSPVIHFVCHECIFFDKTQSLVLSSSSDVTMIFSSWQNKINKVLIIH